MVKILSILALLSLVSTQSLAQSNSSTTLACDRACLENYIDSYLDAMQEGQRNPDLFASDIKFTENGIQLPLGNEGLWFSMSGQGTYKFYIPDIETQQIAFLGTVRENGDTTTDGDLVAIALRLKIDSGKISEIEQLAIRPSSVNSSNNNFPPTGEGVEAMGAPHPVFTEVIPEAEQPSRDELVTTANYYFSGLQRNDGQGYYPFTDDCVRFENGVDVLARGPERQTCKQQFEESVRGIVSRIRDRRYVAVDRERGIVFSFAFFDHEQINWTWQLAELFKIENGEIKRIEAIFHKAPYGINSGWSSYEQGMSEEIQSVR